MRQLDVTGTPQLTITNDTVARNVTASYSSGTTTNELVFSKTIGAALADTNAGDVLSIGANALALNGGTIKDTGTNTASTITNSAAIGTAGTITVVFLTRAMNLMKFDELNDDNYVLFAINIMKILMLPLWKTLRRT